MPPPPLYLDVRAPEEHANATVEPYKCRFEDPLAAFEAK